jgi:hypothetical protein
MVQCTQNLGIGGGTLGHHLKTLFAGTSPPSNSIAVLLYC